MGHMFKKYRHKSLGEEKPVVKKKKKKKKKVLRKRTRQKSGPFYS